MVKNQSKNIKEVDSVDYNSLLHEIKRLNNFNNGFKYVILRGLSYGFFSSIGATFGFTIFLVILGFLVELIGGIPFISNMYADSGIKKIIDYQLEKINNEEGDNNDNSSKKDEYIFTDDNEDIE